LVTKKIFLVGCGNIGSRHLQALAKLPYDISVNIVEPNENSRSIANARLREIPENDYSHNYFWHESINRLNDNVDLVIVATPASGRAKLMQNLVEMGNHRFLVEKMVCQSIDEYKLLMDIFKKSNMKAWVNITRRYFPSYRKFKQIFQSSDHLNLFVTAGNLGLGGNAIHFIDLFSWFCNNNSITIDNATLNDELLSSKRGSQFVEFAGTLKGSNNKSNFEISFSLDDKLPCIINIFSEHKHLVIDETKKEYFFSNETEQNHHELKFGSVSTTGKYIIEDIIENDSCFLPSIADLFSAHRELFRIFNHHIHKITNKESNICPIT